MSSILTNNSAMVALQTLKSVNKSMTDVQGQISTGKKVASSKDNSAVWAISKVMESDVRGFKGISESLALGGSTVAVARSASESVTDLLADMKGKIVAAQEENVDRDKIQTDIDALKDQISAVVGAAQFNGLNLLSNTETTADSGTVNILSSLDRSSSGVTAGEISVGKQDLGTSASAISATGGTFAADTGTSAVTLNATLTGSIDIGDDNIGFAAGAAYALNIFGTDADGSSFDQADYRTSAAAASTQTEAAANDIRYVARDGDTATDVATGLQAAWTAYAGANGLDSDVLDITASGDTLTFTSTVTSATDSVQVNLVSVTEDASNTIGGGLELLNEIDVSTSEGATSALGLIEGLSQTAIDAAASFGSVQSRIETQSGFIESLTDSLKSGIGTLVDANMEEASARLQALQVQQQLAVQAMSIANQAPQTLLSLFR